MNATRLILAVADFIRDALRSSMKILMRGSCCGNQMIARIRWRRVTNYLWNSS